MLDGILPRRRQKVGEAQAPQMVANGIDGEGPELPPARMRVRPGSIRQAA